MDGGTFVVAFVMLVGLIGIVVPLVPGLPLVWVAVLVWASETQTTAGWVVFGIATALALAGLLLRYFLPGRRMAKAGITTSSTVAGALLGTVGFFVVPVVGVFLGFVLGIYVSEGARLGTRAAAWSSTKHALKAIMLSTGIELLSGVAIATTWVIFMVLSA